MADNQLNYQINIGGNAGESVGSLKKQLREAQAEVGALSDKFGATSKEAIEAAKRAAELKDRIGDAKALTDAFNPDAKFKALSSSLSGVAGGFAAVQGAIGLFGAESKELEKQLLKVQSALALSQGLQSIGESIDSFKQLGAVIQSTTIFTKANQAANTATAATMKALGIAVDTTSTSFKVLKTAIAATGIGLAVIAIGELISAISNYTSAADKAKEAQDKLNESITKSAEGGLKAEIDQINRSNDLLIAQAKLRGASEKEIFEIEQSSRRLRVAARNRFNKDVADADKEAAEKNLQEIRKEQDNIVLSDTNFQASEKERRKKINDEKLKEQIDLEKAIEEGRQKAAKAGIDFDLLQLERQEAAKKEKEDARIKEEEEGNRLFEEANERENKRLEEQIERRNKLVIAEKNAVEEEKKLNDAKLQSQLQLYSAIGSGFANLSNLFAQGTAASKAAAIADLAVNTGIGFIQGLDIAQKGAKATGPAAPFAFPIFYASQVAAVLSAASKAKGILSQVKGPQGGSISAPNTSITPIAPQAPQAITTNLSQASINDLGNSAIRAFVVETDITTNQQRVQAIKQRARFS